jgi:hypothetical protein
MLRSVTFVQCHHVRGFAESGGWRNPASKPSPELCAHAPLGAKSIAKPKTGTTIAQTKRILYPLAVLAT